MTHLELSLFQAAYSSCTPVYNFYVEILSVESTKTKQPHYKFAGSLFYIERTMGGKWLIDLFFLKQVFTHDFWTNIKSLFHHNTRNSK